jgi:hypothetical protein
MTKQRRIRPKQVDPQTRQPEPHPAPAYLLEPRHAASILHCSEWTLAEWRCTGAGPDFVKVGRLVRYSPGALQAWIERNTCTSTSDDMPKVG